MKRLILPALILSTLCAAPVMAQTPAEDHHESTMQRDEDHHDAAAVHHKAHHRKHRKGHHKHPASGTPNQ